MGVFGYCRVSTQKQASEGESLEVQRRQIEGYALMHDLAVDRIVVEEGVSGSVPVAERPAGGPLFAGLTKGDVIIAPKLDWLFRSALDALTVVEDLRKRGVALHLLDLGGDISGNGLSKLFLTIAAAFAEAERDRIRERIGQVKADQKARGRYLGGTVPFGYRIGEGGELVPHEGEQEAIRAIEALRAVGQALRPIAAAVRAMGHRISHEGVAGVLRAESGFTPGGDAKAIAEIARRKFGGFAAMFEHHGWPERGSDMMRKVQTRVAATYGSVRDFEARYAEKAEEKA
jgi:DNA invertase Pin-like site-specific DNA recombinase